MRNSLNIKLNIAAVLLILGMQSQAIDYDSLYHKSIQLQYQDTDAAIENYNQCLPYFEENGDLEKVIGINIRLIKLNSGIGNYQKAYDIAWATLPIVEPTNYYEQKTEVNKLLVSLYIIFSEFDKANVYLNKAINEAKKIEDSTLSERLLSSIYSLKAWLITNETGDFEQAKALLLKATNYKTSNPLDATRVYPLMQLAELYIMHDSLKQAELILNKMDDESKIKKTHATSLLYDHMGQLHMKKKQYERAISYFQKCIYSINKFKNHLDNKIEVLDSLSSCYYYLGKNDSAYYYSRQSKIMSDELFGGKSKLNKELFEVKDLYQEQIEEHKVELIEQEKENLRLKTIIYVSILILIIVTLMVRSKIRNRKQKLYREKQEFQKQQKEIELENKNKELTSSALQLIERDALLNDIRKNLNSMEFKSVNQKVINELVSTINANKVKKWDEFELYFTSVNENFYKVLKERYPSLSSTDLKMCALIKLGMSSKDMADVMAIGTDSVNTSRSRIRKKMSLKRGVNLLEHLRDIK